MGHFLKKRSAEKKKKKTIPHHRREKGANLSYKGSWGIYVDISEVPI